LSYLSATLLLNACSVDRSSSGSILLIRPVTQSHDYIPRIALLGSGRYDPWLAASLLDGKYLPYLIIGLLGLQVRRMIAACAQ
jgi:hypothetical protein